ACFLGRFLLCFPFETSNRKATLRGNHSCTMNFAKFALVLSVSALSTAAANWPNWRGPNFNGSSPEKNLPAEWSKTENIAWQAELPGPSAATPAVWENNVFVSSPDTGTKTLQALCLDRRTGKV